MNSDKSEKIAEYLVKQGISPDVCIIRYTKERGYWVETYWDTENIEEINETIKRL